ncbi:MAG TPA: FKBP-type peptidyl-prolyl cis-trans isomerase [Thermoanaerobaculia bacterium]
MRIRISSRALIAALLAATGSLTFLPPAEPGQEPSQAAAPSREVVTPSGLKYLDLKIGKGEEAVTGKIVEVRYIGRLEDGTKFDACRDSDLPFTFRLGAGDAIKGWDEGLAGMRVGGKRKLVIPPELGFGKQGVGSVVPPNAVLVYEFELLAVR